MYSSFGPRESSLWERVELPAGRSWTIRRQPALLLPAAHSQSVPSAPVDPSTCRSLLQEGAVGNRIPPAVKLPGYTVFTQLS